jgi:acyl carrier protein
LSPGANTTTTPEAPVTTADVLETVRGMIADVVGEDYLLDLEIEMETSFDEDLELESIEFVALAEKLDETYGERVDFVAWIAGKELDEIIGMTVGELVEHITACLGGAGADPAGDAGS